MHLSPSLRTGVRVLGALTNSCPLRVRPNRRKNVCSSTLPQKSRQFAPTNLHRLGAGDLCPLSGYRKRQTNDWDVARSRHRRTAKIGRKRKVRFRHNKRRSRPPVAGFTPSRQSSESASAIGLHPFVRWDNRECIHLHQDIWTKQRCNANKHACWRPVCVDPAVADFAYDWQDGRA